MDEIKMQDQGMGDQPAQPQMPQEPATVPAQPAEQPAEEAAVPATEAPASTEPVSEGQ